MDATMKRLILFALMSVTSSLALADTLTLKPGHPDSYIVQKGDTLWDISAQFLNDPWRWPKLWGANPQIANPHLIYPGDRLTLVFIDGEPRLVVKPQLRKSPEGRKMAKDGAIPAIDLALIQPYLVNNRVVDPDWFGQQAMVLGGESPSRFHVSDNIVYVHAELPKGQKLGIYDAGRIFTSKVDDSVLGQEIILSASGRVVESGPISKVELLTNLKETRAGFRAIAIEDDSLMSAYFMPKPARITEPAYVLGAEKKLREVGKLDVVYISQGSSSGVEPGDVFSIYRDGETVVIDDEGKPVSTIDRNAYENLLAKFGSEQAIKVPDIYHGNLMVFKVFDKVSMGLIMVNDRPVRADDKLTVPESANLRSE
ncbi:LysM peptidoglycan-binding domain-containing protein [Shewanella sedimentimangrovi]|uniref:LysM peptidoglycan-binding domain-containing protein n=1 Tax=Shewanella sedimentimangrovi TaxID=2814293 RepID=A0ABX7R1Z2_9GAMM|nr:LysM domain-containing protein [Shewanella sedimentimangrovi]QSX37312.1 LysM peptidoglycan-binding domain-containing protein [Shewanella sedimentimangrovi]